MLMNHETSKHCQNMQGDPAIAIRRLALATVVELMLILIMGLLRIPPTGLKRPRSHG